MQLNDTTPDSTTPSAAPAVEATPAAEPVVEALKDAAPAKVEASIDEDLAKVYRNANKPRAEDGKFAPANPDAKPSEAKVEAVVEQPGTEQPKPEAKPAVDPPRAWAADMREKWAGVPPEVQSYVAARENELHEAKSNLGRVAAEYGPVREVLGQYGDYLKSVGQPLPTFINNLMAASQALDTNPGDTIKQLARMYGVDLGQLWDPSEQPPDPKVTALERENQQLRSQREYQEQQRAVSMQTAREQEFQQLWNDFQTKTPDAKDIHDEIVIEIAAIQRAEPNLEPAAILQKAYDRAAWVNEKTRSARIKQQFETQERAKVEAAKKAAEAAQKAKGVNVAGAVRTSNGAGDLDSDLRSIWRKNAGR